MKKGCIEMLPRFKIQYPMKNQYKPNVSFLLSGKFSMNETIFTAGSKINAFFSSKNQRTGGMFLLSINTVCNWYSLAILACLIGRLEQSFYGLIDGFPAKRLTDKQVSALTKRPVTVGCKVIACYYDNFSSRIIFLYKLNKIKPGPVR